MLTDLILFFNSFVETSSLAIFVMLQKTVRSIDEEAAAGEAGMVPPLEESGAEDASGFSALGKISVLTIQSA